jgi:predicted esterase
MNAGPSLGFFHRFVPSASGPSHPTLLLLHGTGGDENDLVSLGKDLLPNANILSPRGKVSEQGMNRWFRRFAIGNFNLEDLRLRTYELADFIKGAIEHYSLHHPKVIAVGYSNGANIAASLLLRRPELLASAVLLRPSLHIDVAPTPNLKQLPVFIASGDHDPYGGRTSGDKLAEQLTSYGAIVARRHHPGGHELADGDVIDAGRWLTSVY